MSELSERIGREHLMPLGRGCVCSPGTPLPTSHAEHIAAMTEAAVRETIAAESVVETRQHYACSTDAGDDYCEEAFFTGHCEHEITQTRNVTPWKDADA